MEPGRGLMYAVCEEKEQPHSGGAVFPGVFAESDRMEQQDIL